MDEGLLLEVEIVLGLDTDFVGLLMCLLKDEVDLLFDWRVESARRTSGLER